MIDRAFGDVLRRLRMAEGLSQEEFGFRAKLHRTYVSQLERGLKSPSLRTMAKVAAVLKIDIAFLLQQVEKELANVPTRRK
jgi:transcriptional regulator with XRE-family HTH domain